MKISELARQVNRWLNTQILDGHSCPLVKTIRELGCLAVNSTSDYQRLCALDVLGLADNVGADSNILDEFKEQLTTSEQGYYETGLVVYHGKHTTNPCYSI